MTYQPDNSNIEVLINELGMQLLSAQDNLIHALGQSNINTTRANQHTMTVSLAS